MSETGPLPFRCQARFDQPELVAARWWQQTLRAAAAPPEVSRRDALRRVLIAAGVVTAGGVVIVSVRNFLEQPRLPSDTPAPPSGPMTDRPALELQREKGWDAGHTGVALRFDGACDVDASGQPWQAGKPTLLVDALRPRQEDLRPFYVPTLFQSLEAPANEGLVRALRPIFTPDMHTAFAQATAVRGLFAGAAPEPDRSTALIVDLDSPQSVAFAAGLVPWFEPVFALDNWPHPKGVVPSHLTLAATVYWLPVLTKEAPAGRRPPAFVLDRQRLAPYSDDGTRFDNRYVARLPDVPAMQRLGVKHVLYVVPKGAAIEELDDLNELFVALRAAEIDVKVLTLQDVAPPPDAPKTEAPRPGTTAVPTHYYHGNPLWHWWFWRHYPYYAAPRFDAAPPPQLSRGPQYLPMARQTLFSRGLPPRFGVVPQQQRTGSASPSRSGRSGSWGRSGGGYSG
jgi:hypothetical protein